MLSSQLIFRKNIFIRYNPFIRWNPFVSIAAIRLELSRQKMLLRIISNSVEQNLPLSPLLISFAEDQVGSWNEKLLELAYLVKNGRPLTDALEEVGGLVPVEAIPIIKAGIATDNLSGALKLLSQNITDRSDDYSTQPGTSFISYLVSLIFVITIITGFLMVYIIPKFKKIVEDFNTSLPDATENFIYAYYFFVNYFYLTIPIIILGIIFVSPIFQCGSIHISYLRKTGYLKRFTRILWIPDILRALSLAPEKQKPLIDVIRALVGTLPDKFLQKRLTNVQEGMLNGKSIWISLTDEKLITHAEKDIFEASERSGNLPWTLKSIATRREIRSQSRYDYFVAFFEPTMILLLGLVVMVIVIGLFTPLLEMITALS